MSDQPNETKENGTDISEVAENGILDGLTDIFTGGTIPSPVKKNALKAFGQLCTALIDIPVAHLEGIAAEKRAVTQSRIKILSQTGDQIANQMEIDPHYARMAELKYGQRVIKEQVNLDSISAMAAQEIDSKFKENGKPDNNVTKTEINEDWLNNFEQEARTKTSNEMRLLFAKILAAEIEQPTSFSIKSVKLMSELDNQAAKAFKRLCSLCVSISDGFSMDARVVAINGNPAMNSLKSYGLPFGQLNLLHEYGLIIGDYNSWLDYKMCVINLKTKTALGFKYQGKDYGLLPLQDRKENQPLKLNGVALSRVGQELLKIVDIESVPSYTEALQGLFEKEKLKMVPLR